MAFHRGSSLLLGPIDNYAAGDSQYEGNMEFGTASMEAITAVIVGPLCLLLAAASVHDLP